MEHKNYIIENVSKLIEKGPGGIVISDFDDGHIPENLRNNNDNDDNTNNNTTKLVNYPMLFGHDDDDDDDNNEQPNKQKIPPPNAAAVNIFHNALPQRLVDAAYSKTVDGSIYPSWGDYVTLSQIQRYWNREQHQQHQQQQQDVDEKDQEEYEEESKQQSSSNNKKDEDEGGDDGLMIKLAAHYLKLTMNSHPTKQITPGEKSNDEDSGSQPDKGQEEEEEEKATALWNQNELDQIHGIALWGLEANIGSQVPYHLDYAEQIRYESNLIVPPLLAGTLQCTKDKLIGGDFLISLEGIPHYLRHGYKGAKMNNKNKANPTCDKKCNEVKNDDGNMDMIRIPYRYNQLTCHYGNLPHSSSKIENIVGTQKRVIVGFNVFGHDFGPLVQQAPEHSDAFRRKVQSQRALNKKMSFNQIRQNKSLTKLLVLAKREKIKYEYIQSKNFIQEDLPQRLPATVHDLMALYCSSNNNSNSEEEKKPEYCWPSSNVDVQVFLHHQIQDGKLQVINMDSLPSQTSTSSSRTDLVSPMALIDLPTHPVTRETRK